MADEEQNENVEETTSAAEAEAPEAAAEAVEAEAPEAAAAADEPGEEQPAEAAPAGSPKEQRRQARAAKVAAAAGSRPQRTPEERQAERDAARKAKAARRRGARARARERAKAAHTAEGPTPPREHGEGRQKVRQGIVVSDKADKTITVRIDVARRHRRYEKIVRSSSTLHAHDERNDAHVGDTVVVRESRPLSRLKRWRLVEVVERAR